ncbi:unnamed protein product [Didymodactylos carnosus]|uniref:VLIG-type G domain-containing protein n=1 Tax=Didymodactylos carnosus TaxID=1234261 RepID=A0A8S2D701_9BILA|nr:unnamed protein product [Didymodactylos carnosus]CAF3605838.1 unnamed protein product [Didymodactylos carnosus]
MAVQKVIFLKGEPKSMVEYVNPIIQLLKPKQAQLLNFRILDQKSNQVSSIPVSDCQWVDESSTSGRGTISSPLGKFIILYDSQVQRCNDFMATIRETLLESHCDLEATSTVETDLEPSKNSFVSMILAILDLDTSQQSSTIVDELLEHGRQKLADHRNKIPQQVFETQFNSLDSQLLQILKEYTLSQWHLLYNNKNWFRLFIESQRTEVPEIYEQILLRQAEYENNITNRGGFHDEATDTMIEHGWNGISLLEKWIIQPSFQALSKHVEKIISHENDSLNRIHLAQIQRILPSIHPIQLQDLLQAGEFKYANVTLKQLVKDIVDAYKEEENFSKLIENCCILIMYLLKRQQNLDTFTGELCRHLLNFKSNQESPSVSLRMFIHILLHSGDKFLRRIIMSLLSKRNPVPLLEPNLNDHKQIELISEIIHVWDYSRPTILSFGIGSSQGKSSLLNKLFMCDFEQSQQQSIYFHQSIDVEFGYNSLPRRSFNIADVHGQISIENLSRLIPLFDGFIIQVNQTFFQQNTSTVLKYLDILPGEKWKIIVSRDAQNKHVSYPVSSVVNYVLPNIIDSGNRQNQSHIENLRTAVWQQISDKCLVDTQLVEAKLRQLCQVNDDISDDINSMKHYLIHSLSPDEYTKQFPLYQQFVNISTLRQYIAKLHFYNSASDELFTKQQELFLLEAKMKQNSARYGEIFDTFMNILKSDNYIMLLDLLGFQLNAVRGSYKEEKEYERAKVLSLEVLWRNAIVCQEYHQVDTVKSRIRMCYYNFIYTGFPFEIIDGDNFHLHSSFLSDVLTGFKMDRTLVISIIGPQNSGKSTLLNYMFGALFDVREGRCTRGVYGSFIKLSTPDYDAVLLIDTEGLLGIQKDDKEYDRQLVLFCLAVSHVVIVNMIGELTGTLKDMLTLCADSLKQLGVNKVPQPILHFVINQKADLDMKHHTIAIEKIIADIENLDLGEIVNIRKDMFHTLPSAYKKDYPSNDTKLPGVIRTELDFIERSQALCEHVMSSACQSAKQCDVRFTNPCQWLRFATNVFDTLKKFPDLTYFNDVSERRQDRDIRDYIQTQIKQTFTTECKQSLIDESTNKSEQQIEDEFQTIFQSYIDKLNSNLDAQLKIIKASVAVKDRSRNFLKTQICETKIAWKTACVRVIDRQRMELLIQQGSAELKALIDEIIKEEQVLTPEAAKLRFDNLVRHKTEEIKAKYDHNGIFKQSMKFVYGYYSIFEKESLSTFQEIIRCVDAIKLGAKGADLREWLCELFCGRVFEHETLLKSNSEDLNKNFSHVFEVMKNGNYMNKTALANVFGVEKMMQSSEERCSLPAHKDTSTATPYKHKQLLRRHKINQVAPEPVVLDRSTASSASLEPTESWLIVELNKKNINLLKNVRDKLLESGNCISEDDILPIPKIFKGLLEALTQLVKSDDKPSTVDIDLIQKIVSSVNTIFHGINCELEPLGLCLSKPVKSLFHEHVIIFLAKIYYDEQMNHFESLLITLAKERKNLEMFFIRMVVPNTSLDCEFAENLNNELLKALIKIFDKKGEKAINDAIQINSGLFNRGKIQNLCDIELINKDNDWIFNYITDPDKIIKDRFTQLWRTIVSGVDTQLQLIRSELLNTLNEYFDRLQQLSVALQTCGPPAHFINESFQFIGGGESNVNDNFKNKGLCMTFLLYTYFSNSINGATGFTHETSNKNYMLKENVFKIFQEQMFKPSVQLIDLTEQMKNIYLVCSIDNPLVFLNSVIAKRDDTRNTFSQLQSQFIDDLKTSSYITLLDKICGCFNRCPCCGRPCDADHTSVRAEVGSEYNKHVCRTGHQFRGMAGYKFEITDEASLLMCEDMKDSQLLIINGIKKTWSEFKTENHEWDFDTMILNNDALMTLRGKYSTIWEKVGQQLCEKYHILYVTNNRRPSAFHYILLLDGSASMKGKPWSDLIDGIKSFINLRKEINQQDRITIIVFSDVAQTTYSYEEMKNVDISQIKHIGGGTNFGLAFETVISTMAAITMRGRGNFQNQKTIIIFMSDGEGSYPKWPLETLATQYREDIEKFWTVFLYSDSQNQWKDRPILPSSLGNLALPPTQHDISPYHNVLSRINKKMNGEFKNIKHSTYLVQAYAEIAQA